MENIDEEIKKILETPFWPQGVDSDRAYFRTHDDCDGNTMFGTGVAFSQDGDAWIWTTAQFAGSSCRYRMPMIGGGRSPRVRNALLILAMAIKMDNEEAPIT